ncbi:MAG: hypothetical protein DRJ42_24610, partial [Deltaproteobacteria bacterium]
MGLITGCNGLIGEAAGTPATGDVDRDGNPLGPEDPTRVQPLACDGEPEAAHVPMRLLTQTEYNRTVRDLFGDDTSPLQVSPSTGDVGFDNDALGLGITSELLETYADTARQIAERAAGDLGPRGLLSCDPTAVGDRACAVQLIGEFGTRAFRRPLGPEEEAGLIALYDDGATDGGFTGGMEQVIRAVLEAPDFLYHVEVGEDAPGDSMVPLTHWEIASRLSYFLWNTMPDAELFRAAEVGELGTAAEVRAQAERMLDDPRARASVDNFHTQWLGLRHLEGATKDPTLFPEFTEELRRDLRTETLRFTEHVTLEGGTVEEIFAPSYSMMNASVARYYGLDDAGLGEDFERVEVDPSRHAGILTHASIMAANAKTSRTSPVHRGVFVRTRILCQSLPAPPPGIPPLPDAVASQNERERLEEHRTNPACQGCHRLMDPVGLAFEHYDAAGQYREMDVDGSPIDATGELIETLDIDGPIDGALELSEQLANSEEVRECVTRQWFRYALARPETEADACSIEDVRQKFSDSGYQIRELLLAITESDAFR